MFPNSSILFETFQTLFGFWPVIFLVGLDGLVHYHRQPARAVRRTLSNLLILWTFFAVIRVALLRASQQPTHNLIPESLSTVLFLTVGVGAGLLLGNILWNEHNRVQQSLMNAQSIADLLSLSTSEFQYLVARIYRSFGHRVDEIDGRGDQEVDLVVLTPNNEKWIVQCQRWQEPVSQAAVRDLYGLIHHENAHRGTLITTSTFTPEAQAWAEGKPIHLYDGEGFLKILKRARESRSVHRSAPVIRTEPRLQPRPASLLAAYSPHGGDQIVEKTPSCPNCDASMVRRIGLRGDFEGEELYVCSNFPDCQIVLSLKLTH